jgi:hypothetical protein
LVVQGADAPPVGLAGAAGSSVFAGVSLAGFSFSADAPPEGVAVLAGVELDDGSPVSLAGVSLLDGDVSPVLLLLVVVVVAVEVVCAAAASAVVFVGGVISGVLLGTASETLLPPHPPIATAHSNAAHAVSARRALTAVPYACRTWGSR